MNITNISQSIFEPFGQDQEPDVLLPELNDTLILTQDLNTENVLNRIFTDTLTFTQSSLNIVPILVSFFSGVNFSLEVFSNMILGNNSEGKNCILLGDQCHVEGLNTQAGFSAPCTLINNRTVVIYDANDLDFFNGCQVTLYNLSGGSGPTQVTTYINNVSTDGTDTFITFSYPVTNHTSGYIALSSDFQSHSEGQDTIASGKNSNAGGKGAIADLPGKLARSDTYFNRPGDGQYSFTACSCVTTDDTPTILMVDNRYLKIRENMSYAIILLLGARKSDGSDNALFLRYGIIKNINGTVSLNGSIATLGSDINSPGWDLEVTADDVNKSLAIEVTGEADTTINWKARVDCIEIG